MASAFKFTISGLHTQSGTWVELGETDRITHDEVNELMIWMCVEAEKSREIGDFPGFAFRTSHFSAFKAN